MIKDLINDPLFIQYIAFWTFVIGMCVGSFLNVVALRGLTGESIVLPPSKCPKCGNKLKWWMNLPVVSYLFLRGKCFYCKTGISIQYPIVEFVTGLLFLFIFLKFGYSVSTVFYLIAASILMVMTICDLKESVIFDMHAYILIAAGIILNAFSGWQAIGVSLIGAVSGFILYEIAARSGYLFVGQRAFGEGDSLIAAGIGAFFGWKMMLASAFISVIVMSLFTFPYFFIRSYKQGKKKTCIALISSIFIMISAYLVSKIEIIKSPNFILFFFVLIMILTFLCAKAILEDMHKPNENNEAAPCMLPFGPAMAISFILVMFFNDEIRQFFLSYVF